MSDENTERRATLVSLYAEHGRAGLRQGDHPNVFITYEDGECVVESLRGRRYVELARLICTETIMDFVADEWIFIGTKAASKQVETWRCRVVAAEAPW